MKQVNGLSRAVAAITLICLSGGVSFALEVPRPIGGQAGVWVETDRFIYRPGEKGAVTVTASNATDQEARVEVVLIAGVGAAKPLCTVSVPAGARKEQKAEFATDGLQWGCEVLARASVGSKMRAQASDYFAVADGPWQVAVMSAWPPDREQWETPEGARAVAAKMRADGFNGYEAFFWGECDLLDFTPDTEQFFGGQGAYPCTITGMKNVIRACHEQGMAATFYANLWGGSGRPAFELMRQHPEWFAKGNFRTWVLDDWDLLGPWWDMRSAQVRAPGAEWNFNQLHIVPPKEAFELHANEIIASHNTFGWDAVRYDSYYTRWWNVLATRMVKQRVRAAVPQFQFGYNSLINRDTNGLALADMVGDGGLVMGEAVRIERINDYANYAKEVLRWRDIIWSYGGHYGLIYNKDEVSANRPYHSAILLAAGVHPYYNKIETEAGKFPRFAVRYSEFLYDNRMRHLKDPASVISFGRPVKFLHWQDYARTLDLGAATDAVARRRLVLHLIDLPEGLTHNKPLVKVEPESIEPAETVDRPAGTDDLLDDLKEEQKKPAPAELPVTFTLPQGATATGAWELTAVPEPRHRALSIKQAGAGVTVAIRPVNCWTVIVLDFDSPKPIEHQLTVREQTDTFIRDWQVVGPFPNPGDNDSFDKAFAPEEQVDLAATYEGIDGKQLRWKRVTPVGILPGRPLDLCEQLGFGSFGCSYAFTEIESARDRDAWIFARADDTLSLWVNGERVFHKKLGELQDQQESKVKVHLREGRNSLLAKVCQKWLYSLLAVRVAEEDGTPLETMNDER